MGSRCRQPVNPRAAAATVSLFAAARLCVFVCVLVCVDTKDLSPEFLSKVCQNSGPRTPRVPGGPPKLRRQWCRPL